MTYTPESPEVVALIQAATDIHHPHRLAVEIAVALNQAAQPQWIPVTPETIPPCGADIWIEINGTPILGVVASTDNQGNWCARYGGMVICSNELIRYALPQPPTP